MRHLKIQVSISLGACGEHLGQLIHVWKLRDVSISNYISADFNEGLAELLSLRLETVIPLPFVPFVSDTEPLESLVRCRRLMFST